MTEWGRRLPNGKEITALGFGCSSIWAREAYGDQRALSLLSALAEEGLNHLDTAPSYGDGVGESRLGMFMNGRDLSRFVISTKVGTNLINGSKVRGFKKQLIESSFEASLRRLGLDHVDILYLHGPSIEDLNDDVFLFFEEQKSKGRITYSGANTFDSATLEAIADTPIDAVMLQFNVGDFRNASQIDLLHDAGKIVISGTAMARAKFSTTAFLPKDKVALWYLLRMLRNEPLGLISGANLARRLRSTGKSPTEAAIQFATGHPKILSNLFGTSNIDHARANARAGHGSLTAAQWNNLYKR